jgi:hypothetical protein
MSWSDPSDGRRILAAVILIFSGGIMVLSYQGATAIVGVPLLSIGIFALLRKPNRGMVPAGHAPLLPSSAVVGKENDDSIQIMQGGEVGAAYLLLKSAGIPAFLKSSHRLMVPRSSVAQARELLDSRVSEKDLIAAAEAPAQPESTSDNNPDR